MDNQELSGGGDNFHLNLVFCSLSKRGDEKHTGEVFRWYQPDSNTREIFKNANPGRRKPWITREDPQACEICASNFVSVCLSTADFFFFIGI